MTREDKSVIIDELKAKFAAHNYFYLCNASGMTVEKTNRFRRMCSERGVEYKVYKNTLIKLALESSPADYTPFTGTVLKGMSGVLFTNESGKMPATLLKDFYRANLGQRFPELKGASIDTALYIGADQLDALATIKNKNELIGEVIGLLQSPAKNVISALQSGGNILAGILKTLSEKGENAE